MHLRRAVRFSLIPVVGLTVLAAPGLAQSGRTTGPIARYDMRAGTVSGQTGRPSMAMMFGGRGGASAAQHELYLRLGSSNAPTKDAAKADHAMPKGALLGPSVPLLTPKIEREPETWPEGQRPKGRLLVFWGCGEHAGPGQPVVIDFAKLAAGQMPPGLWSSTVLRDWGPTLTNSRTFARWPNEDGTKYVKPNSSLLGAHRITATYAPTMDFTLTKDFMAPLSTRLNALPSGAKTLGWDAIPDATGYLATMFGGTATAQGEMGDMVMWSSSATRQFGAGLADWLSPGQVAGLVRDRTVLPPTARSCAIPAEAIKAAGTFRAGMLTAFGPQEDFAYPPRPADPRAVWAIEWTARIRHKSTTSWMDMPGMEGMAGMTAEPEDKPASPPAKCKKRGGLGGMIGSIGGVLSGGGSC